MSNSKRKCGYKPCGQFFKPESGNVGTVVFCNEDHKIAWAIDAGRKLRVNQAKIEKQESTRRKKEFYSNDYSHQFDLTKKAAQKLANWLDAELTCISCDCVRSVQFCGGHFRTVGAHREMALDIRNIHGQCNRNCNMGLSGNIGGTKKTRGYRRGLVERYGQAFVEFLETYNYGAKKTCADLAKLRAEYAAEIRRLEKGLPPSRNWRALPEQRQAAA